MVLPVSGWVWFLAIFLSALGCLSWSIYAWERSKPGNTPAWLFGGLILLWLNFKHYLWALWGLRLRLDPDYPCETRFRGDLVVDSVLEYRGYGLFVPWCALLALLLPKWMLWAFSTFWMFEAYWRAEFYNSPFKFWTRAYNEAPTKNRNRTRYFEELSMEIERRLKAGADWNSPELQQLMMTAREIQDCIVERIK